MSCNYADGLSPYENKGVLGLPEKFDSLEKVKEKCTILAEYIKEAKHIVVHTGAGISTSAGIPDFRGPNGVWTLEEKGLKPNINISFNEAKPTKTHLALKKLIDEGIVKYIVSQNIDGLHLKSGVPRECLAELHGNMFIEQCHICKRQFVRSSPAPTVGLRNLGGLCRGDKTSGRPCRGRLQDTILDWEHSLPDDDLDMADMHASMADLSICLGTTLQIVPSGNIPLNTLRYGGKLVICNLQPTKHDNKADLIINTYVDDVIESVMKLLELDIPVYESAHNPATKPSENPMEWTLPKTVLSNLKTKYKTKCDGVPKVRLLVKRENDTKLSKVLHKVLKRETKINNGSRDPSSKDDITKREQSCESSRAADIKLDKKIKKDIEEHKHPEDSSEYDVIKSEQDEKLSDVAETQIIEIQDSSDDDSEIKVDNVNKLNTLTDKHPQNKIKVKEHSLDSSDNDVFIIEDVDETVI